MTKRAGQLSTEWMEATRQKYGRSPINATAMPLKGHEQDHIEPLPQYWEMKEHNFAGLAVNREDERRRLVPRMPRHLRKLTYTRQRLRGFR